MLTEELGRQQLAVLDTAGFRLWYFNFDLLQANFSKTRETPQA